MERVTLPGEYYTDPELFEQERRKVFGAGWIPVGRASDVDQLGDFIAVEVAEEPVVVVRADDGIRAFGNVCRHRSTVMLEGRGSCSTIRCPYHQWTYRLDGTLAAAPSMQEADGFDKADHGLFPVAVDTWGGWLLVSLDGGIPPVAEQCPSLGTLYDEEWLASLVPAAVIHADSAFNWKIQVENFAESYHHAGVHAETLQPVFPGQRSFVVETGDEPWCSIDHVSAVEGIEPFTVTVVFPHLLFSWTRPDVVVWFDIRPVSVDRTALDIRILVEPGDDRAGLEQFADTLREINDEDAPINERTQAGLASRFSRPGRISHLEGANSQFRSWLMEQLDTA